MRDFLIASRAIVTRGRARAWTSIWRSISDKRDSVKLMATRTTWESVPCSAWESRSEATKTGFEVRSAII